MSKETNDKPVVAEEEKKEDSKEADEDKDSSSMEVDNEDKDDTTKEDKKVEAAKEVKTKKDEKETKEESEEGEEDEDDDDDEPQVGLLERPVVIEEGKKRERKKVERMSFKSPEVDEKKFEVEEGKGTPLGDIPFVEFKVGRTKAEDLKVLHRLLFRRAGSIHEIKRNIRKFSGFPFSKDDAEFEKRSNNLKGKSFTIPMVKSVCELLDVARSGTKEEICDRLMDWLAEPSDSGRKVPAKKRKRESKDKKGKKKSRASKKPDKKQKKKSKVSDDEDDEDEDDDEEEEEKDEEEESDADEDSDAEESEEEPPKKKAKKPTPKAKDKKVKEKKPAPKPKKAAPKKKATPVKKKAKEPVSDEEVSDISSDSDSDDEPLVAKTKPKAPPKPPTNEELKDVIKKMLDNANLEEVTMKTILKDVFNKYPSFDLTDRKDFIKNTVKQIIS